MKRVLALLILLNILSCTDNNETGKNSTYVRPSVDNKGNFRKGHVRKSVSTSPNAIKNRNRSKYYYKTRGKFRKRKKKDD